jgi:hypothetical protein
MQLWSRLWHILAVLHSARGKLREPMSIRAMQNMIAEAGKRAPIKEPVTPILATSVIRQT